MANPGFQDALVHFESNAKSPKAASGGGKLLSAVSKIYPAVRHLATGLVFAAAMGAMTYSQDANALEIDERVVAEAIGDRDINFASFTSNYMSTMAVMHPDLTSPEAWARLAGPEAAQYIEDKGISHLIRGDIAINQVQLYFSSSIQKYFGDDGAETYYDFEDIFSKDIPKAIGTAGGSFINLDKYKRDSVHFEDAFMLHAIAYHHNVDPKVLEQSFGRMVANHEIGHSITRTQLDFQNHPEHITGEYIAEISGVVHTFKHLADVDPTNYQNNAQALIDAVNIFRAPTQASDVHNGAAYAGFILSERFEAGDFSLDRMNGVSRGDIDKMIVDYANELDANSIAESSATFIDEGNAVRAVHYDSYKWINGAAKAMVAEYKDPKSEFFQTAKNSYSNPGPSGVESSISNKIDKFRVALKVNPDLDYSGVDSKPKPN